MKPGSWPASGWVSWLVLLALVTGCEEPATAPKSPSGTISAGPAARFPARIRLPYRSAGLLAIDGGTLVLPVGVGPGDPEDRVVAVEAPSRAAKVVAKTRFAGGFINWAVTTGGWVIWVDQSAVQSDLAADVHWRIWARPIGGGRPKLLSTNGSKPDPYVPWLAAADGYVAWATSERDRSARQWIWKVGDVQPRTVLRNAELSPDIESIDDGKLVYLGPSSLPHHGRTIGGDCWSVGLSGGTPVALTHTGLALDCRAGGGRLVWFTHIDPKVDKVPPEGVLEGPWGVWVKSSADAGGEGTRLSKGYTLDGTPAVTKDLIVWPDGNDSPYHVMMRGQLVHVAIPETARNLTASGDTIAFLRQEDSARGPVTIRFVVP